jgi:hypothetical protein
MMNTFAKAVVEDRIIAIFGERCYASYREVAVRPVYCVTFAASADGLLSHLPEPPGLSPLV